MIAKPLTVDFQQHVPHQLLPFLMVLHNESDHVYITGGAVRDLLISKHPNDYDIVTDVPMDRMIDVFTEGGFGISQTGVAHLVLNVTFGSYTVEISNFRKDTSCDGRHAVVEIGTMSEDAHRRDFTINAMYINTKTGELFDPTGKGIIDIQSRTLRFVGKPKDRIREDYIRGWRAMRFAQNGWQFEPKSLRAVRELWHEIYENSNHERVRTEIEKLIKNT
jgi:tRNA nucleotidyltransferase/poly(A) polymerase